MAQWIRICLPVQGTRVHPWSEKTPHTEEQLNMCATTTESTCHNCWPRALQPTALELQTRPACSRTCAPQQEATTVRGLCTCPVMKSSPHSPQLQKSPWSSEEPAQPNIKKKERKKERLAVQDQIWAVIEALTPNPLGPNPSTTQHCLTDF